MRHRMGGHAGGGHLVGREMQAELVRCNGHRRQHCLVVVQRLAWTHHARPI